jgi:phage terminase small subunit
MPRKSAASLTVVPVEFQRPDPPDYLDAAEAAVWRQTVNGMRPDWYSPVTDVLLEGYCSEAVLAKLLAQELRGLPVTDKRFATLTRLHMAVAKSAMALARTLRLTPRSNRRVDPRDSRDPSAAFKKPWET